MLWRYHVQSIQQTGFTLKYCRSGFFPGRLIFKVCRLASSLRKLHAAKLSKWVILTKHKKEKLWTHKYNTPPFELFLSTAKKKRLLKNPIYSNIVFEENLANYGHCFGSLLPLANVLWMRRMVWILASIYINIFRICNVKSNLKMNIFLYINITSLINKICDSARVNEELAAFLHFKN